MLYFVIAFIAGIITSRVPAFLAGIITSRAARRLDAARRRSAAVTFQQAYAACILADAGILPTRTIRRTSRRRPVVRAAMTCAAAAAAAVLLAAPLLASLAGADVRAAAHSIVRQ